MKLSKILGAIDGGINTTIKLLSLLACGVLAIMLLVVFINVIGRFLFNKPFTGTVELVELIMVIIGFFAMAYTAMKRGHVIVDIMVCRLSRRTQAIMSRIVLFLSFGIFATVTYQGTMIALYYARHMEQASTVLKVPFAPAWFVMVLGCLLLCLKLLMGALLAPSPDEEPKGSIIK